MDYLSSKDDVEVDLIAFATYVVHVARKEQSPSTVEEPLGSGMKSP